MVDTLDPLKWSVDQVVLELCSATSTTAAALTIKPILDLAFLERALRDNDVDGEVLLALEDVNIKEDLGIQSFGQRRELRKIIRYLRSYSQVDVPLVESQTQPQEHSVVESSSSKRQRATSNSERETLSTVAPTSDKKRRRVVPENISAEPVTITLPHPVPHPKDFDSAALEPVWLDFLHRHQDGTTDLESDSEDDGLSAADEEEGKEGKKKIAEGQMHRLSLDAVTQIVDNAVVAIQQKWATNKRPKKYSTALKQWKSTAKAGTRRPLQYYLNNLLRRNQTRLRKFRSAIEELEYTQAAEVEQNCRNLEAAVEDCAEQEYYLEALESNRPPAAPVISEGTDSPPQEQLGEDEELIESSSSEQDQQGLSEDDVYTADDASSISLPYDPQDTDWEPTTFIRSSMRQLSVDNSVLETRQSEVTNDTSAIIQPYESISGPQRISELGPDTSVTSEPSANKDAQKTLGIQRAVTVASQLSDHEVSSASKSVADHTLAPKVTSPNPGEQLLNGCGNQTASGGTELRQDTHTTDDLMKNSDLDVPSKLPQSRYRDLGRTRDSAIDLLSSPPASMRRVPSNQSITTPPLNPVRMKNDTILDSTPEALISNFPPPIQATRKTTWSFVKKTQNIELALCKPIYAVDRSLARGILQYITRFKIAQLAKNLRSFLNEVMQGAEGFAGIIEEEQEIVEYWTYVFVVYTCCDNGNSTLDGFSYNQLFEALAAVHNAICNFDQLLRAALQYYINTESSSTASVLPDSYYRRVDSVIQASSAQSDYGSTDEELDPRSFETTDNEHDDSTAGRRARHNQSAINRQKDDRKRVKDQEARRALLIQNFQSIPAHGSRSILINSSDPPILLNQHIAQRVKDHQIDGIRFIWREVVEDDSQEGCLLAHTMGLGKTMQVISFLVTLVQCAQSSDETRRGLIPTALKDGKVLILCPASLLDNWCDEFHIWTPPESPNLLGRIYKIGGLKNEKIRDVLEWHRDGGILLVSYESFRSLMSGKNCNDQLDTLVDALINGPNIAVADEAHKMKNPKSGISIVSKQFRTKSRIALTGSPLNNHLAEYHTMIDWIAPGYLGTIAYFKERYSNIIEEGLYITSTKYERRKSLERLYVLKRDLAPKINRADISAIAADMPQKTEFYVTIALTDIQRQLYRLMIQCVRSLTITKEGKFVLPNSLLWSWLCMFSWLCNHPSCLWRKLRERSGIPVSDLQLVGSGADLPDNINVADNTSSSGLLEPFEQILRQTGFDESSIDDPELSYRSVIVRRIIVEASQVGDKVLLFSHSIPTLDYLGRMLSRMNCAHERIDGSTDTSKRQEFTKRFNDGKSTTVFLISTRAGGLGLNLQGANRVIIYDFGFNPSWEEQAVGRAYRLGQKKPVFVYKFKAASTYEDVIYNKNIFKTSLFSRVVDHKNVVRHAQNDVGAYLQPPDDVPVEDYSTCIGKDDILDTIHHEIPEAIRNVVLTETFEREDQEDELTPEERALAEEALKIERKLRQNPDYMREALLKERELSRRMQQLHGIEDLNAIPVPWVVPNVSVPEYARQAIATQGRVPTRSRDDFNFRYTVPITFPGTVFGRPRDAAADVEVSGMEAERNDGQDIEMVTRDVIEI